MSNDKPTESSPPDSPQPSPERDENPLIPDEVRDIVQQEVANKVSRPAQQAFGLQAAMGNAASAFTEKLDPDHVHKVLDYTEKEKTQAHYRALAYYGGAIALFLILFGVLAFIGKDDLLETVVVAAISFAGGIGVGKGNLLR